MMDGARIVGLPPGQQGGFDRGALPAPRPQVDVAVNPSGTTDTIVQASRLRKVYRGAGDVEALRGVDLVVQRGEMLALVGPSGSGKTTLLNCLSGLDRFDSGTVVVDGADLAKMSDRARTAYRGRNMGFIFQAFNLLPVLTAVENVEIPLLLQGVSGRDARVRALEMLETLGLAHRAKHRPDQLSGGEQQRVAVARALVHRPGVVWADEPTGNLDTEVSLVIVELMRRMNADGQTIVLVTHNPQVAERAGRVLRMRDGRIEPPANHLPRAFAGA
jgi:putative ABC transport system ATP-binding protein